MRYVSKISAIRCNSVNLNPSKHSIIEDDSFLRCNVVQSRGSGSTFQRCGVAVMLEAVRASETSVCFHKTTRRYMPESCNFHTHRRENLKSLTA
jgi:hypothetical protein